MDVQVKKVQITPEEASQLLRERGIRIETETLREGIEQGVFPFGVFIQRDKRVFIIGTKKFSEWCFDFFGVEISFDAEGARA